jgi:hypothetical protein
MKYEYAGTKAVTEEKNWARKVTPVTGNKSEVPTVVQHGSNYSTFSAGTDTQSITFRAVQVMDITRT